MSDQTGSHEHDDGHEDGHIHRESGPPQPDDKVHSYYQILGIALKELLIEKGIVKELNKINEKMDCSVCDHAYSWHRKTTSGRICDFLGCSCVLKN